MVRTSHSISGDNASDARLRAVLAEMENKHMKNEPTLLFGGGPLKQYIDSGNSSSYPAVPLLEEMRSTGGSLIGGVNRLHKAKKWANFLRDLIPSKIRDAVTDRGVKAIQGSGLKQRIKKVIKDPLVQKLKKKVNRVVNKRIKNVIEKSAPKVAEEIPEDWSDLPAVPSEEGAGYAHHSMVKRRKNASGKKPSLRNAIVKKVMKEQGLKLMAASAYVKKHKLYVKDSKNMKPK